MGFLPWQDLSGTVEEGGGLLEGLLGDNGLFAKWNLDNVWGQSLVVLLVAFAVSFVLNFIISQVLKRLAKRTKTDIDDHFVGLFRFPIRFTIVGGALYIVSLLVLRFYLGQPQADENDKNLHNLLRLIATASYATLMIIMWTQSLVRFTTLLVDRISDMEDRFAIIQPRTKPLFHILFKILFVAFAIYLILTVWERDITGWVTSAGVLGLAVGFAARDTLANFFSGIFIIADAPYKLGDYVVLGNGDRGRVTHIGIRSTRLLTRDDVEITIPNAIIGNTEIFNQSGGPHEKFRLRVKVGVAYGSDVDKVRSILENIAFHEEDVMEDPTPRVRFRAFGDSSLDFELLCWVAEPGARGKVTDILLTKIYKAFNEYDVEIPFPKRDVYLHTVTNDLPAQPSQVESDDATDNSEK